MSISIKITCHRFFSPVDSASNRVMLALHGPCQAGKGLRGPSLLPCDLVSATRRNQHGTHSLLLRKERSRPGKQRKAKESKGWKEGSQGSRAINFSLVNFSCVNPTPPPTTTPPIFLCCISLLPLISPLYIELYGPL